MPDRSADWLKQAKRDLENARWEVEGGFYEWGCFVCQQASEKALKGVYQRLGGQAWGHSVAVLLEGLREKVKVEEDLIDCGKLLDRFYITTRYPNGWNQGTPQDYYTKKDTDDALRCGDEIIRFCEGLLAEPG